MNYLDCKGLVGKAKAWFEEDKKRAFKIFGIVLIIVIAVLLRVNANAATVEVNEEEDAKVTSYVDISGAVNKPGIYSVNADTRLYEVIELAGGLKDNADIDSINQAEFIEDGEKILIPYSSENEGEENAANGGDSTQAKSATNGKININSASKEELKQLTGIGDVIADRIIDYRASSRFKSIEDIKQVKGIGDSIYEKIKDNITA